MYKLFLLLRAGLFYLLTTILVVIFVIALYLVLPFPFKARLYISRTWSHLILCLGKWICGIDYEIQGKENLLNTPVIFLVKHQSAWETLTFPSVLPPNCFVCKDSLLKIPIFGWGMRLCRHIPIDRQAGLKAFKKVIALGKERLQSGLSIIIFPEGTRVAPKENPKFHKTAASLAKAEGAPVIPIAHNSGSCWRRNSFIKYPGKITVVIGPAIDTKNLTTDEINDQAYNWIKTTMNKIEN